MCPAYSILAASHFFFYRNTRFPPTHPWSSQLLYRKTDTASLKPSKTACSAQVQRFWTATHRAPASMGECWAELLRLGSLNRLYSVMCNSQETTYFKKKDYKRNQVKENHLTKKMDNLLALGKLDNHCTQNNKLYKTERRWQRDP